MLNFNKPNFRYVGTVDSVTEKIKDGITEVTLKIVNKADGNAFVKISGKEMDVVKTFAQKDESGKYPKYEVKWADRKREDVVDNVASFRRYTVYNEGVLIHTSITTFDFAHWLKDNEELLKGKVIITQGNIRVSRYKKQTYLNTQLSRINIVSAEEAETLLQRHIVTSEVYYFGQNYDTDFGTEVLDAHRVKEINKDKLPYSVYLPANVLDPVTNTYKDMLLPVSVCVNLSKIPVDMLDNEVVKDRLGLLHEELNRGVVDSSTVVYGTILDLTMFRGAEVESAKEEDLSPFELRKIKAGLVTLEEVLKSKEVYGERLDIISVLRPAMSNTLGVQATDLTIEKLNEYHVLDVEAPKANKGQEVKSKGETLAKATVDDLF